MEYRRRRNGNKAERESIVFGRALLLLLLFGAASYLILGTGVGKKLKEGYAHSLLQSCRGSITEARTTEAPLNFVAAPQSSETPSPAVSEKAIAIELPEAELYMIQYGFYSDEELCEEAAAPFREMGAAGFCYNDNGDQRLILAAFQDEASAGSVKESLAQQGYDCIVHRVSRSGVSLLITAAESDLETIRAAFSYAGELTDAISELALSFDSETMSVEKGTEKLAEIRRKAQYADEGVKGFSQVSRTIGMLHEYFVNVIDLIDNTGVSEGTRADLASRLKRVQLGSFVYYCGFLDDIGGAE